MKKLMAAFAFASVVAAASQASAAQQYGIYDPRNPYSFVTSQQGSQQRPYALTGSDRRQTQASRQDETPAGKSPVLLNRSAGARPLNEPTATH